MKILGINISHDSSMCLLEDGNITWYSTELKWAPKSFIDRTAIPPIHIPLIPCQPDLVIYSSFDRRGVASRVKDEWIIEGFQNVLGHIPYVFNPNNHHIYHAYNAFNYSECDEGLIVVLDGRGSQLWPCFHEIESIYYADKNNVEVFFKHLTCYGYDFPVIDLCGKVNNIYYRLSNLPGSGNRFEHVINSRLNNNYTNYKDLPVKEKTLLIKNEFEKLTYICQDEFDVSEDALIVKRLHTETAQDTINLIHQALQYRISKNIILTGGYALNKINKQAYTTHFCNHNFYFDPLASDSGTSIGAALWLYDQIKKNKNTFKINELSTVT